jgi:hypothetical protein
VDGHGPFRCPEIWNFSLIKAYFSKKYLYRMKCIAYALLSSLTFTVIYLRGQTFGELFEKAVDKTLNNKDFMKFAEEKKGYDLINL